MRATALPSDVTDRVRGAASPHSSGGPWRLRCSAAPRPTRSVGGPATGTKVPWGPWSERRYQPVMSDESGTTAGTSTKGRGPNARRLTAVGFVLLGLTMVLGAAFDRSAQATKPEPEHKVMLCHATSSRSNPYVLIEVDAASVQFDGHDGHDGPVFSADLPEHEPWGDVIPPFDYGDDLHYAGKNWPTGEGLLAAACTMPTPSTTSSSTTSSTTSTTSSTSSSTTSSTTSSTSSTTTTTTTQPAPPSTTNPAAPTSTTTVVVGGKEQQRSTVTRGLPFTGTNAIGLALTGLALIVLGLVIARRSRT